MKKIAAFAVLVVLILIAWKKEAPEVSIANVKEAAASDKKRYLRDTISSEKAKRMFDKFKADFKKGQTIISKFDREELITILDSMQTDSVIFFVAMHEDTNPRVKDKGVVLLQVQVPVNVQQSSSKSSFSGNHFFLNRFYYLTGTVCPPPSDCVIQ